jgi:hypothetical protein
VSGELVGKSSLAENANRALSRAEELGQRLEQERDEAAAQAADLEYRARDLRAVEHACELALQGLAERDPDE